MKKVIFTIAFFGISAASVIAQDIDVNKAGDVIIDQKSTIYDRNDVVKEGVINPEVPARYTGVHELLVLPSPVEEDGMATLSFWIKEDDAFVISIEDNTGDTQEEHQIGSLHAGSHQLSIDMAGIKPGDYNVVVRGKTQSGEAKFSIKAAE